uniref:Peptidase M20 n=1 Tax=Parascaris equorum TaxID=6256 RepID=A0A914RI52_PAREQ
MLGVFVLLGAVIMVIAVFNVDPDYTREGGKLTGKNILLLPFGGPDDMPHSQNEKIDMENFIEGTKMMAAYLTELGSL